MNHTEIVMKLIGNVEPFGETRADEKSMENLKSLCKLTSDLVGIIDNVAYSNRGSQEHSVKTAVDYANKFLTKDLGITE